MVRARPAMASAELLRPLQSYYGERRQEMKCEHGEPRADAGEGERALWLNVARPGRTIATRGLHWLHTAVEA